VKETIALKAKSKLSNLAQTDQHLYHHWEQKDRFETNQANETVLITRTTKDGGKILSYCDP
jgi:hypothetical protein